MSKFINNLMIDVFYAVARDVITWLEDDSLLIKWNFCDTDEFLLSLESNKEKSPICNCI